jgi:hypothetical protein
MVDEVNEVVLVRTGLVNQIKDRFLERARSCGARTRSQMLIEFRKWLSRRRTHKSCLACLLRAPEHKLACQHVLCEDCCVELGHSTVADPNLYEVLGCPICAAPCRLQLRVRPATAGLRILAIDGGGIRAVIPIQFLRALQRAISVVIGSMIPVQEFFDLSFGTSSGKSCTLMGFCFLPIAGAMVNLALYGLGMEVGQTLDAFKQLSLRVFQGRARLGFGPIDTIYSVLAASHSGRFPAEDIDAALHEFFGKDTMLEHPYMTAIGARTGFPVVNLDTLDTCIITSYNGACKVQASAGMERRATYQMLRSGGPDDEISVKDA